jgi:hypothetical protein
MAGCLGGGIIVNCDNYGQICGDAALTIGGMVGWFESSPNMVCKYVLRNCHNYGGVMGARDYAGGLVGYAVGNVTEILIFVDCVNSGDMYQNALCGGILGMKSGFNIRILNVYNTGNIGAQYLVGGIVGQMEGTDNLIVNTYNAGLLTHEIENYVCPRGAIVGHSAIVQNCQACYWLSSDEYGSNGQGPEVGENSSAFDATQSPTVWSLESVVFDTQDLLEALNAGAEYIESQFPDVGTVSRWREDFDTENGGFPVFGTYDAVNDPPSVSSVEVYPNPGQTTLNIRTTLQNARVEVYDTNGRFVHSQAITENVTAIDATGWLSGAYVWKVIANGKEAETGKWVKE